MLSKYDIAFLGGGPAGYQGAIRAAQLGARVAVVEEQQLGGVCLNWGCIPTKAVRASAEVARSIRRAKDYGFQAVEVAPDISAILARKDKVVASLRKSIEQSFIARKIDIIEARGHLINSHEVGIEKIDEATSISAEKIVIATGSRPASLPVFPETEGVFLAENIFNIKTLPHDLVVVGGGAIGVEMAAIFRELGSRVTLIEIKSRLLPSEDVEMGEYLESMLRRRKIKIICDKTISSSSTENGKIDILLSDGSNVTADTVILAVGRVFNTLGIGLENVGISLVNGHIKVNECMQTSCPGIYAAGDVTGGWLLAHVAFAEGICAAENALGSGTAMDYRVIPRTVFSIPEYSAVGISEEEAANSYSIKVARFPFKSSGMGQASGELEGLVKIICDSKTDLILGAHIIGPDASSLISEIALAMQTGAPVESIMRTVHIHPSFSEAVLEVAQALHGQAIHISPQGAE